MSDITDVTDLVAAFQAHNNCTVTIKLRVTRAEGLWTMVAEGRAFDANVGPMGHRHLASAQLSCTQERCKSLGGLLTGLLYRLDFLLAQDAFGEMENQVQSTRHTKE